MKTKLMNIFFIFAAQKNNYKKFKKNVRNRRNSRATIQD